MVTALILASAAAATAVPAADIPRLDYFCSAPLTHSSQILIRRGGNFYRISGSLQPVQLEPVPDTSKPLPFDGVTIPSTYRGASAEIWDDESHAHVGIHLVPHNRQPDGPETISDLRATTWIDGDQRSYEMGVITTAETHDPVPFEIVIDGDKVDIKFGDRRLKLEVPFGPKTLVDLNCVGGQFFMEDVKIGGR